MLNIQFEPKSPAEKQETVISPGKSSRFFAPPLGLANKGTCFFSTPNETCKRHVCVVRFRLVFLELRIFYVFLRFKALIEHITVEDELVCSFLAGSKPEKLQISLL